jgi:hypothetical protein
MSEQGAQMIADRWVEDEAFRQQLRQDPDAAARTVGAELEAEQVEWLRSIDWTLSDEELEQLLTKGVWC